MTNSTKHDAANISTYTGLYPEETRAFYTMTFYDLANIYNGLTAAMDGLWSIVNQPRTEHSENEWLHEFGEDRLSGIRQALIDVVEDRGILTDRDAKYAWEIISKYETECCSSPEQLVAKAAELQMRRPTKQAA